MSDPNDTRAFGYIYNTNDDRHQFWAIKTERAAMTVVLALRDVFDIAFQQRKDLESTKSETNQEEYAAISPESPSESNPVTSSGSSTVSGKLASSSVPVPTVCQLL